MTRARRCAGSRKRSLRESPRASSRSATRFTIARRPTGWMNTSATCSNASAARRTGSGSPAITIRRRRPGWAASSRRRSRFGRLVFRHEPGVLFQRGEIAGHLHPCTTVNRRGRSLRRRCFVSDGRRMVLPAFGAYAGGLDVWDAAIAGLFEADFGAYVLGNSARLCRGGPRRLSFRSGGTRATRASPAARPSALSTIRRRADRPGKNRTPAAPIRSGRSSDRMSGHRSSARCATNRLKRYTSRAARRRATARARETACRSGIGPHPPAGHTAPISPDDGSAPGETVPDRVGRGSRAASAPGAQTHTGAGPRLPAICASGLLLAAK